jgi:N-methylhydantoinase B
VTDGTDPVLTEILRNAFISIAEQMNRTLIRTAHSPVIYEMRDCSVGLFDRRGRLLGQSSGLPIFLGNLEEGIRVLLDRKGEAGLEPGDVYLMNDAYLMGTHLSDITVVAPIFVAGELIGYSVSRAHWRDVGAADPGATSTQEIYQEGIRLGPTRIVRGGEVDEDILDILQRNSRTPELLSGDLHAQLAAAAVGERGVTELLERYPLATLTAAAEATFAQSEALEREAVAAIPDGTYRARGALDSDGRGSGPVEVVLEILVAGDEMTLDLSGSSPQVLGCINCGRAQTISGCRVAYKMLIHPEAPVTGGSFRPLKVRVPEGSIFDAREPAACQFYFTPLGLLIDLFVTALAPALPERAAAAHFGDSMVVDFVRRRAGPAGPFFFMAEALAGGWGASAGGDGESALINNVNGGFRNMPVEVAEAKFPMRIRRFALRRGSEGDGRHRGGMGIVREYEVLADGIAITLHLDRSHTPAWGLEGGGSGSGPEASVDDGGGWEPLPRKVSLRPLARGAHVRIETGGGGGYGAPKGDG